MAGSIRALGLVALLAALLSVVDVPLPYPVSHLHISKQVHPDMPLKASNRSGVYSANTLLREHSRRLLQGQVHGVETPIVGPDGALYIVDASQTVRKAEPSGSGWELQPQPLLHLGSGRVLAGQFDSAGALWLCDAVKGLLRVDLGADGGRPSVELVASKVSPTSALEPGSDITYADDLDIAADGTIYFTDATTVVPVRGGPGRPEWDLLWSVYESLALGRPTGRLLRYSPATGEVHVLAQGFWFANGVALSRDESYVVVADSLRMALVKVWVQGPDAGKAEPLLTNIAGIPDGVSPSSDGHFWVALYSPPVKGHQIMHYYPVKLLLGWLPKSILPKPKPWGAVLKVSGSGEVLQLLEDPQGEVASAVTAAVEHQGRLLLGNLHQDYVALVDLQAAAGGKKQS